MLQILFLIKNWLSPCDSGKLQSAFRALENTGSTCKAGLWSGHNNSFFRFNIIKHALGTYPYTGPAVDTNKSIMVQHSFGFDMRRIELPNGMDAEFLKQSCCLRGTCFHAPSKIKSQPETNNNGRKHPAPMCMPGLVS